MSGPDIVNQCLFLVCRARYLKTDKSVHFQETCQLGSASCKYVSTWFQGFKLQVCQPFLASNKSEEGGVGRDISVEAKTVISKEGSSA